MDINYVNRRQLLFKHGKHQPKDSTEKQSAITENPLRCKSNEKYSKILETAHSITTLSFSI